MDLVGYSVGGGTYCLIYAYMLNGSLEDQLHCEVRQFAQHSLSGIWEASVIILN